MAFLNVSNAYRLVVKKGISLLHALQHDTTIRLMGKIITPSYTKNDPGTSQTKKEKIHLKLYIVPQPVALNHLEITFEDYAESLGHLMGILHDNLYDTNSLLSLVVVNARNHINMKGKKTGHTPVFEELQTLVIFHPLVNDSQSWENVLNKQTPKQQQLHIIYSSKKKFFDGFKKTVTEQWIKIVGGLKDKQRLILSIEIDVIADGDDESKLDTVPVLLNK